MGIKTILNEFIAYVELAKLPADALEPRSRLIMVPERIDQRTGGERVEVAKVASSTMDAIVRGTAAGLELLLNICAMLIVLVALVHLANAIIGLLPAVAGAPITLQRLLAT